MELGIFVGFYLLHFSLRQFLLEFISLSSLSLRFCRLRHVEEVVDGLDPIQLLDCLRNEALLGQGSK